MLPMDTVARTTLPDDDVVALHFEHDLGSVLRNAVVTAKARQCVAERTAAVREVVEHAEVPGLEPLGEVQAERGVAGRLRGRGRELQADLEGDASSGSCRSSSGRSRLRSLTPRVRATHPPTKARAPASRRTAPERERFAYRVCERRDDTCPIARLEPAIGGMRVGRFLGRFSRTETGAADQRGAQLGLRALHRSPAAVAALDALAWTATQLAGGRDRGRAEAMARIAPSRSPAPSSPESTAQITNRSRT
jgi:hypothetical protein